MGGRQTDREGGRVTTAPSRKVLLQQKNIASQQINIVAEKNIIYCYLKQLQLLLSQQNNIVAGVAHHIPRFPSPGNHPPLLCLALIPGPAAPVHLVALLLLLLLLIV